jgi:WD40 repeat protein
MKYVVYAIVLALSVPLYSQEIRLDSLWIKMGGYPVMAFSPDSKVLVLGSEILEPVKGAIRFFEVETGKQLDSITKISFIDFGFSPSDGNLYIVTTTSIDVYDKQRMLVRRMPYTKGGLLSFSPDGSLLLMTGEGKIRLVKSENAEVVREITRPSSYKGSNNQDIPFNNGRVNFSSDGTLLYGKNAEEFGSWDLTKANTPFVRKMTIGNRAVIGFTPDNRYMIQQSNYIWDLNTKAQVQIEGLESYYSEVRNTFCTTPKGELTVVTQQNRFAAFIDIPKRKMLSATPLRLAYGIQISPDSMYLAHNYGDGSVLLNKIQWSTKYMSTR